MNEKTLYLLEYPKVLDRLASYCAFAASVEKAKSLRPTTNIDEAYRLLTETTEAVQMLVTRPDLTIGGARDVRAGVDLAVHGGVLPATELLDIKYTLIAARNLARVFERLEAQFPHLFEIALRLPPPLGLIDVITRSISDHGDLLDSASDKLAVIRRDMRIAHDRLMAKLQRIVTDPKNGPKLQEALITQRDGRYVIPLRAEFKGQIKAIIHDQSASGATLFVEPLAIVEHNNQYRELLLAERDEERRILAELSYQVGRNAPEILRAVDTMAEIDLAFAKAKYADDIHAAEPILHLIPDRRSSAHPGSIIHLYQARHPLLNPATVVPIDVELDQKTYAVIITGPNTGGKTVTLKTVGLLALMAQSGLHIPAHSGSEISLFKDIFADIGDEQSIEQSLSTFSSHITNIIRILDQADANSLVILDELGAGTDPQEGAALARSILNHLLERSITTLVTTHHPELKAFAHATPGAINASVEFDLETLKPTFHLTIGLPGRSNALAIAQRLGMPETIVQAARGDLDPGVVRSEDLLNEIHHQRNLARQARSTAEKRRSEVENLRTELAQRLERIEDERRSILEKAQADAEERILQLEEELRQARRSLARARQPLEALQPVEKKLQEMLDQVDKPIERQALNLAGHLPGPRLGDKVRLRSLNMRGVITSLGEEEVEVQVGVLRIRARLSDIQMGETAEAEPENAKTKRRKIPSVEPAHSQPALAASPGMELDLRGQRADDALDALERYLDSAYLSGMPFVRIIHGKGTGKLRQAVREALSQHPHILSFETGGEKEGGDGVTVAKLRS